MIEYLIRLLKGHSKTAVLSRGYRRKTSGFILAENGVDYEDIGDEPFQYFSKFSHIKVAVDEQRSRGIHQLLQLPDTPEVVLLDDAFQHRQVQPGLSILLSSYQKPFYKDIVLPTGNLREPRSGYKRADIILITKCPEGISEAEKTKIIKCVHPLKHQSVFFSRIKYSRFAKNTEGSQPLGSLKGCTLVTGIADPTPLVNYLKKEGLHFKHLNFKDHHHFTNADLRLLDEQKLIITTEKDYVRLIDSALSNKSRLYYIEIEFVIDKPDAFDKRIKEAMK
jgi:tetraacyldisaccharide 4'-kinase